MPLWKVGCRTMTGIRRAVCPSQTKTTSSMTLNGETRMRQKNTMTRHLLCLLASGLIISFPAAAEQEGTAKRAMVHYQSVSAPSTSVLQPEKALENARGDLMFSAPPRGPYQEEVAVYQPIVDYLSKVIGRNVVFQYADNWLSYSKDMTAGTYDIVFDGPAFNGWRIEKLGHTPLIRLPEDFVFVVITKSDNDRIKQLKDLAGRKVCAHAPPNLGTLTLQAQFDNPAREPWIVEVKGWDNAYKAMMSGQCVATVLPINNLAKNDKGQNRATKTLYQHKPMPNQAISVGPRIAPELHAKIAKALLSEDGKRATEKLRATYAGKDFVPASRAEYSGLSELLKTSLYYR
jgi:ABC-type phosphate/phosphonate transport system substrate-binding protein